MSKRGLFTLVLSCGVAAVAFGGAIALGSGGTAHHAARLSQHHSHAKKHIGLVVTTANAADFGVLRKASSPLPSDIRATLEKADAVDEFGLEVTLAHEPATAASAAPIWVIPGKGRLCIFVDESEKARGMACSSSAMATTGHLAVALVDADAAGVETGHQRIAGLVPDGVNAVRIDTASGPVSARVTDNVYEAEVDHPSLVTFSGPVALDAVAAP